MLELRRQRPSRARCVPGVTGAGSGWAALLGLGGSGTVQPLCCWACPASGTWVSHGDGASGRGACLCPPAALPAALGACCSWARCSQVSAIEGWCRSRLGTGSTRSRRTAGTLLCGSSTPWAPAGVPRGGNQMLRLLTLRFWLWPEGWKLGWLLSLFFFLQLPEWCIILCFPPSATETLENCNNEG